MLEMVSSCYVVPKIPNTKNTLLLQFDDRDRQFDARHDNFSARKKSRSVIIAAASSV